jgi:hypothetical protein
LTISKDPEGDWDDLEFSSAPTFSSKEEIDVTKINYDDELKEDMVNSVSSPYSKMKLAELKDVAVCRGMYVQEKIKKADLIAAILVDESCDK